MKILDLFCGGGGVSKGWSLMGFDVIGVDINPQSDYPFEFIQKDVFKLEPSWIKNNFDVVTASPKCQKFSWAVPQERKEKEINQIPQTRDLLEKTGLPYIIENVTNAPLRRDLLLCGEMFGLRVIRHRVFEIRGFLVVQPEHKKHKEPSDLPIEVWSNLPNEMIVEVLPVGPKHSYYAQVAGHGGDSYSFKFEDHQKAMGIDWIHDQETLNQAIPPAYSQYIASQFLMRRFVN